MTPLFSAAADLGHPDGYSWKSTARALVLGTTITVTGLALTGCVAAKPDWSKPDASAAQTAEDWAVCQDLADSRAGYSATDDTSPLALADRRTAAKRYDRVLEACMRGKGYFPRR